MSSQTYYGIRRPSKSAVLVPNLPIFVPDVSALGVDYCLALEIYRGSATIRATGRLADTWVSHRIVCIKTTVAQSFFSPVTDVNKKEGSVCTLQWSCGL
jgi:hypothetical protein